MPSEIISRFGRNSELEGERSYLFERISFRVENLGIAPFSSFYLDSVSSMFCFWSKCKLRREFENWCFIFRTFCNFEAKIFTWVDSRRIEVSVKEERTRVKIEYIWIADYEMEFILTFLTQMQILINFFLQKSWLFLQIFLLELNARFSFGDLSDRWLSVTLPVHPCTLKKFRN